MVNSEEVIGTTEYVTL